ncbi:MAG: hypothetical protein QW346_01185 [Candidatus Micrarchaeaceae archaeon]
MESAAGGQTSKIEEIKSAINKAKEERSAIIAELKKTRHRLGYKKVEQEAVAKLLAMNAGKTENIGKLRRMKEKLEFAISTEAALTPDREKELIRRINGINESLEKSIKNFRLKRRSELIAGDIEELNKKIEELEKKLGDKDHELDELYDKLRSLTGYKRQKQKKEKQHFEKAEISFADIAIIKDKNAEKNKQSNNDIDISASN